MFEEKREMLQFRRELEEIVKSTREELASVRTGKVSPSLVENLTVDAYQGQSKLKLMELASISTTDASTLLVSPYDRAVIQDIEKAILDSPLGLSPRVKEDKIYIEVPPLTAEQRQKFLKVISQKVEEGRETLRFARGEIRKKVKTTFDDKEMTEDNKYRIEKEIDKAAKEYQDKLENLKEKKEAEIKSI